MPPSGDRGEIEVHVERDILSKSALIYLIEHTWSDEPNRLLRPKDDGWEWVEVEPPEDLPGPTLKLPVSEAEELMHGIAEEILGVEDPVRRQSRVEGKLEATERHLDDLRRLTGMDHERQTVTIRRDGGLFDMSDPRQKEALKRAMEEVTTRQVVEGEA